MVLVFYFIEFNDIYSNVIKKNTKKSAHLRQDRTNRRE